MFPDAEIRAFVERHAVAPLTPTDFLEFSRILVSSPSCVIPYSGHSVYLLVDVCENSRNSAELHLCAWNPADGEASEYFAHAVEKALRIARASGRTALDFSTNLFVPEGFEKIFSTWEMSRSLENFEGKPSLPSLLEGQVREYYELVRLAFRENPETSVPPFDEFARRALAFSIAPRLPF